MCLWCSNLCLIWDNLCNDIHAQYPTYAILPTFKLSSVNNADPDPSSQTT